MEFVSQFNFVFGPLGSKANANFSRHMRAGKEAGPPHHSSPER